MEGTGASYSDSESSSNHTEEQLNLTIPPEITIVPSSTTVVQKFRNLQFSCTDSNVKYYTGFPTYIHFYTFYRFIQQDCVNIVGNYKITEDIRNRTGLISLTTLEDLFITLVKLRTALPEKIIEDLFNVKQGYLDAIFEPWVDFLANKLQDLPIWLTQAQVEATTPLHLREQMKNVRIIIEYIELCVYDLESETLFRASGLTAEQHRNKNTFKGIVGMAPSGQITFFSGLNPTKYDGIKQLRYSGLIENLEPGDIIMSNKVFGLKVERQLRARNIKLKLNVIQSDPTQPVTTKGRDGLIHINGASQSIKEFKILGGIIPHSILPLLNSIWIVVNHLANFTKEIPIIP